jgi:two-component system OmpR family sensor kinase
MLAHQKDKMRTYASTIASKAIASHMYGEPFSYINETPFRVGIYSSDYTLLHGDEIKEVDFMQSLYQKKSALYLIDQSTHLHMGIKYIVLENEEIFKEIAKLKLQMVVYALISMILVGVIGYFLSRLFLKPIANEREKIDRFIKDTTHELNTPITALLMSVSTLENENSKSSERIKLSAYRISNIYKDLCYLLKDDIQQVSEIEELDISRVVHEQIELLAGYAKSKKITIERSLNSFDFPIDHESAVRLINNIISNALKYSKPKSQIIITMEDRSLMVQDFGVGIDVEDLEKIHQRYYRANSSEGGFGIGLDIVASICKKYTIKLKIESKKGEGTVVSLLF